MAIEVQPADGDRKARIAAVYSKYRADLLKAAQNRIGEQPNAEYMAEEAVQNAFIRVIEGRDPRPCSDSEEKLYAGLMIIVSDEAAKLIQDQRSEAEVCRFTGSPGNSLCREGGFYPDVTKEYYPELLSGAMMKLKSSYRTVLILRCIRRLSVREISERLDMKPKTVYTNITRGKERLRRLLKREAGLKPARQDD